MSEELGRRLHFPNKMSRILLLSLQEVIGQNTLNAVLQMARLAHFVGNYPPPDFEPGLSFSQIAQIMDAVEGVYGIRGGRRLTVQAGHLCFKHGIAGFGGVIGFADFALRVLPLSFRTRIGIEVLAEIFNRYSDQQIALGEDDANYFFTLQRCGFCWGRHTMDASCVLMMGLLEETLYWVTGGRRFYLEEQACVARGDQKCEIKIGKAPLD